MKKLKLIACIGAALILMLVYGLFDPMQTFFPKCIFNMLTGWQCPGCGSQRAVHQLLHGNFLQAFYLNALLMPAFLYGMIGMIMPVVNPSKWDNVRRKYFGSKASYAAIMIIMLFFIGRNLF